ncbi:acyl-homoserine-lactone synthase [Photobacterium kishitanii]|uniref:acyl-homoserine-lactone synthase n=1 Tax=Photobacterium kishitanii TaxID=318456 RepID=UPI000D16B710|nr:acyl-homoserine-lactone synthase [Photobacterium kishitanii]PSU23708.1 autoinducer synthase [Photobacterium kishitanii]
MYLLKEKSLNDSAHVELELKSLLKNSVNVNKNNQNELLYAIDTYIEISGNIDIFQKIVSYRIKEIEKNHTQRPLKGNLYTILTSDIAKKNISENLLFGLPPLFRLIEKCATKYFENILECWATYECYKITSKATKSQNNHKVGHFMLSNTCDEDDSYKYEIVSNIENDTRLFHTAFSNVALDLSSANLLINIETFIKQQHWYEMLYCLDVSLSSEHFILYQENNGELPLLLSTALIQRGNNQHKWLTFQPFFQTENWTIELSNENLNTLNNCGMYDDDVNYLAQEKRIKNLDRKMLQSVKNKDLVCEIIRMAISGENKKLNFILFLTLKYLTIELYNIGLKIAYTIVEQPSILGFYHSVNSEICEISPYISVCSQHVEGTKLKTYQGIVLTEVMSKIFKECNFRSYNKRIITMRKLERTGIHG